MTTTSITTNSPRAFTPEEAFDYCAEITNSHEENFPVASLFLPEEKRPYIQSIYAFARTADDFADEEQRSVEERLKLLDDWRQQLRDCYDDDASPLHPVFLALRETVRKLDIPVEPLNDLLTAFRMDVTKNRYSTFNEVLDYCNHSANPVGRLVLMIFGYRDQYLSSLSDRICTALQLANFWQDFSLDLKKNRIYIPQSDFRHFGYSEEDLRQNVVDERFRRLLKFEVDRTRQLFYEGAELPSLVDRELRLELRLVWFGGMSILQRIEKAQYDVLHRRPVLSGTQRAVILLRGLLQRNLSSYKRKQAWDLT